MTPEPDEPRRDEGMKFMNWLAVLSADKATSDADPFQPKWMTPEQYARSVRLWRMENFSAAVKLGFTCFQ